MVLNKKQENFLKRKSFLVFPKELPDFKIQFIFNSFKMDHLQIDENCVSMHFCILAFSVCSWFPHGKVYPTFPLNFVGILRNSFFFVYRKFLRFEEN